MAKIQAHQIVNLMLYALIVVSGVGLVLLAHGCGFYHAQTPAGIACTDIPILNWGSDTHQYSRRRAIHTKIAPNLTGAELDEELRQLACSQGADAVIDVTQEAHLLPGGESSVIVLTGFTAMWKGGALK